jgi:hypothetical protein
LDFAPVQTIPKVAVWVANLRKISGEYAKINGTCSHARKEESNKNRNSWGDRKSRQAGLVQVATRLAATCGDPVRIQGVSDRADPDQAAYESGARLQGPDAILAGPTFEDWLNANIGTRIFIVGMKTFEETAHAVSVFQVLRKPSK